MSNMSRDDLEIGCDELEDRDYIEYHDALDAAEKAGEPWFSFDTFMRRIVENRSTMPAPEPCNLDELPF